MTSYFCAGYVIQSDYKKGIKYYPIVDDKVDETEENRLVFSVDRTTNYPVGWVIDIEKAEGTHYKFKGVVDSLLRFEELITKYKLLSIVNTKEIELQRLRARSTKISDIIEDMTIRELKAFCDKSWTNKQAVKFYLWELF